VTDIQGKTCLLMHGDTLCSDDTAYLQLRAQLHDPHWQQQFLAQNLKQRSQAAAVLRQQSKMAQQFKAAEIMDVNQTTVEAQMLAHGVQHLIHGHTHRPACHQFTLNDKPAERWVVGDWQSQCNYLSCRPQAWQWVVF
jgi:UDP-2,3-diacylglucosamine hydrolase